MAPKVILIDDVQEIIEVLSGLFEFAGFEVLCFTLPTKAYKYLIHHSDYDCIVCDINMPVMNGLDLFKKFKAETKSKTPFIFYSGHAEFVEEIHDLSNKYTLTTFVNKPLGNPVEKAKELINLRKRSISTT